MHWISKKKLKGLFRNTILGNHFLSNIGNFVLHAFVINKWSLWCLLAVSFEYGFQVLFRIS